MIDLINIIIDVLLFEEQCQELWLSIITKGKQIGEAGLIIKLLVLSVMGGKKLGCIYVFLTPLRGCLEDGPTNEKSN